MKESINEIISEELDQLEEIDMFGKKASANYDRAMKSHHDDLAAIHNKLKDALGDPGRLQQVASEIVKKLALKLRTTDR